MSKVVIIEKAFAMRIYMFALMIFMGSLLFEGKILASPSSSTGVVPHTSARPMSAGAHIPTSPVNNEDYSVFTWNNTNLGGGWGYSACPGTPGNPNNWAQPKPICPNINNKFDPNDPAIAQSFYVTAWGYTPQQAIDQVYGPNAGTVFSAISCPDMCTVTRSLTTSGTQPSSTINPICPQGYAQVGSFNYDYEVISAPSGVTISPLYSIQDMQTLQSHGYTCTPPVSGSNPTTPRLHGFWSCAMWSSHNYTTYQGAGVGFGNPNQMVYGLDPAYNNILVYYGRSSGDTCYSDGVCRTPASCGINAYMLVNTPVWQVSCTCPGPYCYTLKIIPTSLVCARNKTEWKSQ